MQISRRRAAGVFIALAITACTPWQKLYNQSDSFDSNPTPLLGALPAELQSLREEGLALRGDHVMLENELDFPPRLKGYPTTSTFRPLVTPGPLPAMRESRQLMRAAAIASSLVRAALGERFSLLRSGWLDPEKDKDINAVSDRYQLTFYNYAKNEIVTVITSRQGEVIDVQSALARVQPAESREEVDAAINIVRRDERYGRFIHELHGRGILTEGIDNDRYLYLLFYRAPRTPAIFEATVNMSAGKVVSARQLRSRESYHD